MEDYEADGMEQLADEPFVIFLMATHGEGDPTDNAIGFTNWLSSKEREEGELSNVKYSVFGLGNLQYEHFNKMGRDYNTYMAKLGATLVGEYGEGDDDANLDDDFTAWMEKAIPAICMDQLGSAGTVSTGPRTFDYTLTTLPAGAAPKTVKESEQSVIDNQPWLPAVLSNMRELQDKDKSNRSTLHVELQATSGAEDGYTSGPYKYEAGDHIGVRCENNPKIVGALASRLGCDLNSIISLELKEGCVGKKYRFPCPSLLRDCLAKYLDICTPPSQAILSALAPFAEDSDAEALSALAKDKDKYQQEIPDKCLTFLEVLDKFPTCKPSLEVVLELLPRLATRFYSISSSPNAVKDSIHLTVAVVRYDAPANKTLPEREGVASTWFERMRDGRNIEIFMRSSGFHMPKDPSSPIVMVGPGTGLAPFRGFIQDRQAWRQANGADGAGPMTLFFGCRSKSYDYIYQNDLESAEKDGSITDLQLAFSRDQKEKVYVQHLVEKEHAALWAHLGEKDGYFYICGDAKEMARDVNIALIKAFQTAGGLTEAEAEAKVTELKAAGRYQADVWA